MSSRTKNLSGMGLIQELDNMNVEDGKWYNIHTDMPC